MSSIAIEPLLQNKVLLYPEYFHRNTTLWGDLDACWKINNQEDLIEAMHKLKVILKRENRYELAQKCFETVSVHADLDILKFSNIFEH